MFSFLALRILYFPCYAELSLDFKLERIKKKKKNPEDFSKHTILCYSSVPSVKNRNFMSKGKTILSRAA